MNQRSPIHFPGNTRIHLALAVSDLEQSRKFYEVLLNAPPTKVRPGYVKFEPGDPSVNLTLSPVSEANPIGKPATHYGIQVKGVEAVRQANARLTDAGLATRVEENTSCCYAVQDKVWVTDPDGNPWEVFVVLEADAPQDKQPASACCAAGPGQHTDQHCCAEAS